MISLESVTSCTVFSSYFHHKSMVFDFLSIRLQQDKKKTTESARGYLDPLNLKNIIEIFSD